MPPQMNRPSATMAGVRPSEACSSAADKLQNLYNLLQETRQLRMETERQLVWENRIAHAQLATEVIAHACRSFFETLASLGPKNVQFMAKGALFAMDTSLAASEVAAGQKTKLDAMFTVATSHAGTLTDKIPGMNTTAQTLTKLAGGRINETRELYEMAKAKGAHSGQLMQKALTLPVGHLKEGLDILADETVDAAAKAEMKRISNAAGAFKIVADGAARLHATLQQHSDVRQEIGTRGKAMMSTIDGTLRMLEEKLAQAIAAYAACETSKGPAPLT